MIGASLAEPLVMTMLSEDAALCMTMPTQVGATPLVRICTSSALAGRASKARTAAIFSDR
jgi:hypothetical protein